MGRVGSFHWVLINFIMHSLAMRAWVEYYSVVGELTGIGGIEKHTELWRLESINPKWACKCHNFMQNSLCFWGSWKPKTTLIVFPSWLSVLEWCLTVYTTEGASKRFFIFSCSPLLPSLGWGENHSLDMITHFVVCLAISQSMLGNRFCLLAFYQCRLFPL